MSKPTLAPALNGDSAPRTRTPRAIRILLSAASLLFLLLMVGLGIFSMERLSDVNRVSDEIRNRWLQDIRLIGDLNNYMSDYRTGEGTHLLSNTAEQVASSEKEIDGLDSQVARAQRAYEALPHEYSEQQLYDEFAREWDAYKVIAARVLALSHAGSKSDAIGMYMTTSRRAFDLASDTLGRLTDQTVSKARQASERAAGTYLHDSRLIVTAMVVATCLVLATIIYITRSVSRPLLNLARRMQALAAHDTNINIPGTRRDDEIGEMARSVAVFRDNAIALVQSQQRLIEQAAALETTLENERRATAQQRNFVTMTSHEFRTPLTVIDAQAQRLIKLKDRLASNDVLERAMRIRSAVTRLTGIMDSLLGASLLLDGQAVYRPSDFEPAALLHEVCQLHRETTRSADIREDLSELPSLMRGDRKLLFALFSNLLSNALKFSAPGDPVEVSACSDAGESLYVRVRDSGIGIAERDRAHLFERYFRGANAVGVAGSGVGLHLVAMVLELHGGTIEVDSGEGAGSTFTVHLPFAAASLQPSEPSEDIGVA
ncbi:MAG TPA: ATP-binding protein [Steroidobacteraceae bacterium]|nr:ATP-binding protein [Steroidobacteraceae bacterium]